MEEAPDSLLGTTLAGYVLHEELGSGGSATVYRGVSTTHGLVRAIKVIHREHTRKLGKRFDEEVRLLEKLEHRNIVKFYDATVTKGRLVMVLEYLEGQTLRAQLKKWRDEETLPPLDTVLEMMSQASKGVAFAHGFDDDAPNDEAAQGRRKVVVHRDLKPDNLFVTTKKVTKVLDFGIAKALDDAERETPTTIAETTMGTPQYVPPELWDGDQLPTPASDVYSLGITLYEAVTGRHPFDEPNQKLGKKKEAYRETHREKAVKPLLQVRPDAPESLAKVVARATEKNPLSRYPNAKEFGEALRAVQRELAALKERPLPPDVDLSVPIGGATHTTLPLPKPPAELTVPKPLINLPEPPEPEASRRLPVWLAPSAAGATILGIVLAAIVWHRNQDADKLPPLQPSAVVSSSSTPPASSASMAPVVPVPPPQCPANMVLIPKGTFKMGSDEGSSNEKPVHDVPVDAFCMDETEVTVEAYGACVLSKGCASASHTVLWFLYSAADVTLWSRFCNANRAGHEKHPINCVDWNMADTYCKKNDKRLPTEKEWEYSARGTDGRKYPWDPQKGEPRDGLLNACGSECVAMGKSHGQTWAAMYKEDDGFPDTAPVGSFPEGKSFHKVLDMAGNVNEWTDTFYTSNYENNNSNGGDERVIRGGSWYDEDASNVRGATRRSNAPANRIGNDLGFRCAGTPR